MEKIRKEPVSTHFGQPKPRAVRPKNLHSSSLTLANKNSPLDLLKLAIMEISDYPEILLASVLQVSAKMNTLRPRIIAHCRT